MVAPVVHFYRVGWHRDRRRHYAAVLHQESCRWVRRLLSGEDSCRTTDGWWQRYESGDVARRAAVNHNRRRGLDEDGVIPVGGCCR